MISNPKIVHQESALVDKAICLLDRVQELIKENVTTIDSVILFFDYLPLPAFIKDLHGDVVAVNNAYKAIYPVTSKDGQYVIGFPTIIMNQYVVNDLWIQKYKIPRVFEESAPIQSEPHRIAQFLKFPVFSNSGSLVGVAGLELSVLKENK